MGGFYGLVHILLCMCGSDKNRLELRRGKIDSLLKHKREIFGIFSRIRPLGSGKIIDRARLKKKTEH